MVNLDQPLRQQWTPHKEEEEKDRKRQKEVVEASYADAEWEKKKKRIVLLLLRSVFFFFIIISPSTKTKRGTPKGDEVANGRDFHFYFFLHSKVLF